MLLYPLAFLPFTFPSCLFSLRPPLLLQFRSLPAGTFIDAPGRKEEGETLPIDLFKIYWISYNTGLSMQFYLFGDYLIVVEFISSLSRFSLHSLLILHPRLSGMTTFVIAFKLSYYIFPACKKKRTKKRAILYLLPNRSPHAFNNSNIPRNIVNTSLQLDYMFLPNIFSLTSSSILLPTSPTALRKHPFCCSLFLINLAALSIILHLIGRPSVRIFLLRSTRGQRWSSYPHPFVR